MHHSKLAKIATVAAFVLVACEGTIGGSGDTPAADMGPYVPPDCTEEGRALEGEVGAFLQTTCSHAGCHQPIGPRLPNFAAARLPELAASAWVSPGNPERDSILRRLDPEDPTEIMPPTRDANPPHAVEAYRAWVSAGAPTGCATPLDEPAPDPNAIPQDTLFACETPTVFEPSLARIGSHDFAHAIGGVLTRPALRASPLSTSPGPYSTHVAGASLDPATLSLHMDVLEASRDLNPWYARGWSEALNVRCITDDRNAVADIDDACRDEFVRELLRRSAQSREPTADDIALLREFLDEELSREVDGERRETLRYVTEAAFMMVGTLFQPRLGDPESGRLSSDEIAQTLATALSSHPASGMQNGHRPRPELAWLGAFRAAQADGQLDDIENVRAFIAQVFDPASGYVGGEFGADEEARADLQNDYVANRFHPTAARRGRTWLAPRLAAFFREYFDYGNVASLAKDDAGATSRWDLTSRGEGAMAGRGYLRSNISEGFAALRTGGSGDAGEPSLADQLDDTIARMVMEAERSGDDVFSALLTGGTFRTAGVPHGIQRPLGDACDPVFCDTDEGRSVANRDRCCANDSGGISPCVLIGIDEDGTPYGQCGSAHLDEWYQIGRVYDLPAPILDQPHLPITTGQTDTYLDRQRAIAADPAHAQRWVSYPADERSGVLTHPAWLASHGDSDENGPSAVLRGHWVREHLFCETVAGLDLVQLNAQLATGTEESRARDRMEMTFGPEEGDVRCANGACHAAMNSLGLPFEIFNHAGFLRVEDHGRAPDGSSVVTGWPGRGTVEVEDALDLSRELAEDPHARRCFLRHVFRFFTGRYETPADACVLGEMDAAFAGGSLFAALEALYSSDAMLIRQEADR